MALTINSNIPSIDIQRTLSSTRNRLEQSLERLSSGMRINQAGDDTAGFAISEQLRASIRSMSQAVRNANDGISLIQTAEGGMNESSNILGRMRELAMQSANGTLGSSDRAAISNEFTQLGQELDRIAGTTEFNGTKLLDGSLATGGAAVTIQVGTGNVPAQDQIALQIGSATASSLGVDGSQVSVDTQAGAQNALASIDQAIQNLSSQRSNLGATQNRLTSSINNIMTGFENSNAAFSRIRDTDVALETSNYVNAQILSSVGTSLLVQANQSPLAALRLLQ